MRIGASLAIPAIFVALVIFGPITAIVVNASRGSDVLYGAGGRIHGTIYGFNVWDEMVTISWASVTAMQDGEIIDKVSSSDGFYEMYLPSGDFHVVVDAPGYFAEEKSVTIGDGSDYALDFVMEKNNQPIPELPLLAIQVISVLSLLATLLLIRRKRLVQP